jgi:hypothetical protein
MYLMLDQSASMGGPLADGGSTWWSALQSAVTTFVTDPKSAGMTVGIQYFPLNGPAPASCDAPYATPDIELGVLPGNAAALVSSVQAHQPTAFRPTGPALKGAVDHMKAWASTHPGHALVVVLVTSGFANECDSQQVADLAAIAKSGFETIPTVRTFVVGLNLGTAGALLNEVAAAGGSGTPYLIDGSDVSTPMDEALLGPTGLQLACTFDVPRMEDGSAPDPKLIQLLFTPRKTQISEEIPRLVGGAAACASHDDRGWYFDSETSPKQIMLCPGTCRAEVTGLVDVVYGCSATTIP